MSNNQLPPVKVHQFVVGWMLHPTVPILDSAAFFGIHNCKHRRIGT